MVKKICLFLCLICSVFFFTDYVSAKEQTLNELLNQAKANRQAYQNAKNQKELTEQEKAETISQKNNVQAQIASIDNEIKKIKQDVENIKKDIEKKDKEIKEIMKFVQVSEGSSTYLEYIFGASSFTDFIYRLSVAEQLSDYNDKLIKEYNENIEKLNKKEQELNNKQIELDKKEQELIVLEAKLTKQIETLKEGMLDKDREYKTTIDLVNSMKKMGCSGNDTMTRCINKQKPPVSTSSGSISGAQLPSTNGTYMPIAKGRVTSDYGYRNLNGSSDFHTGIDFSNSNYGDNVYSVASGQVILVQPPGTYLENGRNCGNYIVYVLHNINGHPYITSYWHLASASVSNHQKVTPNTVLGKMGGLNSVDACSFGVHVHVNLFDGNRWSSLNPNKGRINLRKIMPQIPARGVYFTR